MWPTLRRRTSHLARIVALLDEQNKLLRELHLRLTGHHPLTRRSTPSTSTRIRSGADVWVPEPMTQEREMALEQARRERAASPVNADGGLDPKPIDQ